MKTINILTVIDTNAIEAFYPKQTNPDPDKPVGIKHEYGYMVATNTAVNHGQGTANLSFQALVGDQCMFFGASGSNQFDDAVLIYGLPHFSGDDVFGTFISQMYERATVVPSTGEKVLPAQVISENFWFYQANIQRKGTEKYKVQFGLWTRNRSTGEPELYGYFQWDPEVTVDG